MLFQTQGGFGTAVDSLATEFSLVPQMTRVTEVKILTSVAVVAFLLLARRLVLWVVARQTDDRTLNYKWSKFSGYAAFAIGTIVILQIWVAAIGSLGTFFGLLTAGLAIALKDLVADLAGWVFILWRRPFDLGDRIQLGDHAGDVVDIRIFAFTIIEIGNWVGAEQSTGRLIHMPNSKVFSEPMANYTAGFPFLWNELRVLVTFESDWRKARQILSEIASLETGDVVAEAERTLRMTSRRFLIHYSNLTPIVYTSVEDSGVLLTIRYLCGARARRGTSEGLWHQILAAFERHDDIDFAYPTQRLYLNPVEGKPAARADLPRFTREGEVV